MIFDSQDHSLGTLISLKNILDSCKQKYKSLLEDKEINKLDNNNNKEKSMTSKLVFYCCSFLETQTHKFVKRFLGISKMDVVMQQNLILDLNLNPNKR